MSNRLDDNVLTVEAQPHCAQLDTGKSVPKHQADGHSEDAIARTVRSIYSGAILASANPHSPARSTAHCVDTGATDRSIAAPPLYKQVPTLDYKTGTTDANTSNKRMSTTPDTTTAQKTTLLQGSVEKQDESLFGATTGDKTSSVKLEAESPATDSYKQYCHDGVYDMKAIEDDYKGPVMAGFFCIDPRDIHYDYDRNGDVLMWKGEIEVPINFPDNKMFSYTCINWRTDEIIPDALEKGHLTTDQKTGTKYFEGEFHYQGSRAIFWVPIGGGTDRQFTDRTECEKAFGKWLETREAGFHDDRDRVIPPPDMRNHPLKL